MSKVIFTILLLFLSSLLVCGQDEPPPRPLIYKVPQSSELMEFTPSDESFKITFAGKPNIDEKEFPNSSVLKVYNTYKFGSTSSITTVDFPFVVDKDQVYNLFKQNILKSPKTEVKNEKKFLQNGLEGNELDVLQGYYYLKFRVFLVGNRVYELKNTVTNWHILSDAKKKEFFDETSRFFDSFSPVIQDNKINDLKELFGNVDKNIYRNNFFGFSLDVPKDWSYKSSEEIKQATQKGLDLYKTDNEKTNKALLDSTKQEVMILSISHTDKNRNFGIGVLKQPNPYILSKIVAKFTKEMFLGNENVKLLEDVKEINLNGTNYSIFSITSFDIIKSKVFITVKKGYSISFVLTFVDSEGENELNTIMKNIKFNK